MKRDYVYKCRRGCGEGFPYPAKRADHEVKVHPRKRDGALLADAALKNSDLYKKREDEGPKEIKVMIPPSYHKKLHGVKLLSGKTITVLVNEALDAYFHEQQKEQEAANE